MKRKLKVMQKIRKKRQMTEGITLVSLVITVIIMLILVGVSISALIGNEGLFARTASTVDAYKQALEKESDDISDLLNELDSVFGGVTNKNPEEDEKTETKDTMAPTIAEIAASDITTTTATLTATGKDNEGGSGIAKYVFYIDETEYKTVETADTSTSITLTFSASEHFCYVKVYDKAGNSLDSTSISVAKHVHSSECYAGVSECDNPLIDEGVFFDTWGENCSICGKFIPSNGTTR